MKKTIIGMGIAIAIVAVGIIAYAAGNTNGYNKGYDEGHDIGQSTGHALGYQEAVIDGTNRVIDEIVSNGYGKHMIITGRDGKYINYELIGMSYEEEP